MHGGRIAILGAFAFNGIIIGSWTARVPAVANQVHAVPATLGLALLGSSCGLVVTAPLTSRLCARFGTRVVVPPMILCSALILPLLGLTRSVEQLGATLFLLGMAIGALDVSMNIAAVAVVRELDRPLMPTFHASYSFGALGGGVLAGLLVAAGWSPVHHFLVIAAIGVLLALAVARYVPGARPELRPGQPRTVARSRPPSRRLLLWLMAMIMLGSAIAEGANGDWSALFLVHERGIVQSAATIGLVCFNVAMAVARLVGERWERRWGPYRLLGTGAALAALGMGLVVLVPWVPLNYLGFALAGVGLAFNFPVTIGLAGAAGRRGDGTGGEREIGFVTTIAYLGFLTGPAMIGGIAQATNLAVALGVVGLAVAVVVPTTIGARWARDRELQRPAEAADRQGGTEDRQAGTGGQRGDHAGTDRQAQREIP